MRELPELTSPEDFAGARTRALPSSLDDLELLVRRELDMTRYPAKSWVLPRRAPDGGPALDVLIVGGGQAGLACAFGLLQQRVTNILVIDENQEGREGPWNTYARMETLRTQKDVGGIEFGIPSLSVRAWFEAQYGPDWRGLYKLPTGMWHRYLQWYRKVLALPVRNNCRLERLRPEDDGLLAAEVEQDGARTTLWARTIVLATGMEGNGIRHIPAVVSDNLPKDRFAHSHEDIDFSRLAAGTVAVLGGSASAFDNAIVAAEHGADVHLFHREPQVQAANPMAWSEFNGYLAHFPDLSPVERWRFSRKIRRFKTGPPLRTVERASRLPNLAIHPGSTFEAVGMDRDRIRIRAGDGVLAADYIILGTGYVTDLGVVAELAEHVPLIARWCDVFTPPPGEDDAGLSASPYLGRNFETLEKTPGTAPWLNAVFNFTRGAALSMGAMPIGLSGIKFGVPRLVQGITRRLFLSDVPAYLEGMTVWQESDAVNEP